MCKLNERSFKEFEGVLRRLVSFKEVRMVRTVSQF